MLKFINKTKLYNFTSGITPPLIMRFIKKRKTYSLIKKAINNISKNEHQSMWHKINNGALKGREIFINNKEDWQKKILDGSYDNFLFEHIKNLDLKNKTILDIGAHIGYSSLRFAELVGKNGKVIAFEPNTLNIDRFNYILSKNEDLKKRIEIRNCAVSSKNGEDDLIFSDNVDSGNSSGTFIEKSDTIWEKEIYEKKIGFKRTKTKTIKLDNLMDYNPSLIKIDIEGAENLLFEGGLNFLKEKKPIILLELHSIYNAILVSNYLNELNYKIEILKKEKDGRCFISAKQY